MDAKLNCLVVDDELFARKGIIEYIEDISFLSFFAEATNPIEAQSIIENNKIDLLFLDVNMPEMTGIDFLKQDKMVPPTIITTAYKEYAFEGYELDIIDYVLKPISFERFKKASLKALDFINSKQVKNEDNYFFVKNKGVYEQILYEDVQVVEALQNYVTIHTKKSNITTYLSMKGLEDTLPIDKFIRIHKSFIVHKGAIQAIHHDYVLINQKQYPVGNTYKKILQEFLQNVHILKK